MGFRLYNSLTRRKDEFIPIDRSDVRLYVCGPTVYDRAHIGNARPLIVFDVLFRLLRHRYGADHVRYVRNITDVDDKIIVRAGERDVGIDVLTEDTIRGFREDVTALGCLPPSVEPRATEHIAEMIAVIGRLIAAGHAYVAQRHVLFDSPSMPAYGALSRRPLDEMIAGARVEVASYKRSDTDFVLWKPAPAGEPGWDSPWGRGRPGWHIECSAMSWRHLGEVFDIHGGGIDLIFPHHENELAQTRCAFGHEVMANVWMHNGFVQVEGEKMSKSTGNFVTIDELMRSRKFGGEAWPGDVIRLVMLETHYTQPIDWTVRALSKARRDLRDWNDVVALSNIDLSSLNNDLIDEAVLDALFDDLNTSKALYALRNLFKKLQRSRVEVSSFAATMRFLGFCNIGKPGYFYEGFSANLYESGHQIDGKLAADINQLRVFEANGERQFALAIRKSLNALGIDVNSNNAGVMLVTNTTGAETFERRVQSLVDARLDARKAKNFAESDRLRDELAGMGVALKDNKDGTTTWSLAPGGTS